MNKEFSRKQLMRTGNWFFLLNSLIAISVSCRDLRYLPTISGFLPICYLVLTEITHIVLLSFLTYIVIFVPLVLILKTRIGTQITAVAISTVGLMIFLIDSMIFDLYRFHINQSVLDLIFGNSPGNVFQFNFSQYILTLSIIFGLLLFERFLFRRLFKLSLRGKLKSTRVILIPLFVLWLFVNGVHAWSSATNKMQINQLSKYYPAFFQFEDAKLLCQLHIVSPQDTIQKEFDLQMGTKLDYPKHELQFDSTGKNPNILFILLDAWNFQTLDSTVMPNIYKFSQQSDNFTHHYSGSNGTQYGITSLFYGLPGIYWKEILATHTSSVLIDELQKKQYDFFIRTSATLKNPPFDKTLFYPIRNQLKDMNGRSPYDRDVQIMDDWLRFAQSRSQEKSPKPVFGFLFFDDLHAICQPPFFKKKFPTDWEYTHYEKLGNDFDRNIFFNLYKNIAVFEDALVGKVLADLKAKGMLENTIVIITADHGQEFNENKKNYWGHNSNFSKYQLQVPFILHYPGIKPKTYTNWTSHYDVVPTLFSKFLKCKNPISDYSVGRSLYSKEDRKSLFVVNVNNNGTIGILEKDKIISILSNEDYDIMDNNLDCLTNYQLNFNFCNKLIDDNKRFFK